MNSLEGRNMEMDYSVNKKLLFYGIFLVSAVLVLALSASGIGFISILIPAALAIVVYGKNIKWTGLLKIYFAILFLIPIAPYKLFGNLPVDMEPNRLFATLLLFLWLMLLLADPALRIKKTGFEIPLLALLTSLIITIALNLNSFSSSEMSGAIKSIVLFISYIIVFYLIVSVLRNSRDVESVAKWLVFLTIIMSVSGIIERFSGYNIFRHLHDIMPFLSVDKDAMAMQITRGEMRILGSADHPIAFTAVLAMFLPLALFYFFKATSIAKKIWYGIGLIAILTASLFTVSATAIIAIATTIISQLLINPRRGLALLLIVIIFVFGSSMIFQADYKSLTERVSYGYLAKNEIGNQAGRLADYPRVWQLFLEKPLFGRGFGTFNPKKYFYLDNQYLGFIVETGVIGTFCFLWLLYLVVKRFLLAAKQINRRDSSLLRAILSSIAVFIAVCFTFDTFGFAQSIYAFFILVALGYVASRGEKQAEDTLNLT